MRGAAVLAVMLGALAIAGGAPGAASDWGRVTRLTVWPAASRAATSFVPMRPLEPVMTMCMRSPDRR